MAMAAKFAARQSVKAKERTPVVSLIQAQSGQAYPPDAPHSSYKGKGVEGLPPKRSSRDINEELTEDPRPIKIPSLEILDPAGHSYSVPVPLHTLFSKSIVNNKDKLSSHQFVQGMCPSVDRQVLKALSDETLHSSFENVFSKAVVHASEIMHRTRGGYNDPELIRELNICKKKLEDHRVASNTAIEEKNKLTAQLDQEKDKAKKYKLMAKEFQAREAQLIKESYERGVLEARSNFLRSKEGLEIIQRTRDVTREATLHSEGVADMMVECTRYYVDYVAEEYKKWKEEGKPLDAFNFDQVMSLAPENSLLQKGDHKNVEAINTIEFLNYLKYLDGIPHANEEDTNMPLPIEASTADPPVEKNSPSSRITSTSDSPVKDPLAFV